MAVPREVLALLPRVPGALLRSLARCAALDLAQQRLVAAPTPPDARGPQDEASCVAELVAKVRGMDERAARGVYAAVCVLVAVAARENAGPAAVRRALVDMGAEDGKAVDEVAAVVSEEAAAPRVLLERTNFDAAHVVDVSWRLDYVLESGAAGSIHAPRYLVELTLQRPEDGKRDVLRFSCSVEQLRDLVYRIQEVANQVEQLAGGAASSSRNLQAASPA